MKEGKQLKTERREEGRKLGDGKKERKDRKEAAYYLPVLYSSC